MISLMRHSAARTAQPLSRRARRMRRRTAQARRSGRAAALLAVVAMVAIPSASAQAGVAVNSTLAQTIMQRRTDVRVAFQVRTDTGPVESASNVAVARSAFCQNCNTVAISVQIDLVSGTVDRVNAENHAEARTSNCIACNTLANAEQFIVAPGTSGVRLTDQGARDLQVVHDQLDRLAHAGLPALDLQPRIDALMDQVMTVLRTEVTLGQAPTAGVEAAAPLAAASTAPTVPLVPVQRRGGTAVAQGPNDWRTIG